MGFTSCQPKNQNFSKKFGPYLTPADERRKVWDIENRDSYRQLSLFDDMHLEEEKNVILKDQLVKEAANSAVFGQL